MLHNNLFQTNLDTLAVQLLPVRRRKPIFIALVKVLIYPFKKQFEALKNQRELNIYKLTHDARVGLVEKVLNDRFDPVDRGIKIGSGNRVDTLYLYTEAEAQQTYLPEHVYTAQEVADRNIDFEVLVPAAVGVSEQELIELAYLTTYYTGKDKHYKITIV